jgi:hypothetical protein
MSKKLFYNLLAVLMLASLVLSACGAAVPQVQQITNVEVYVDTASANAPAEAPAAAAQAPAAEAPAAAQPVGQSEPNIEYVQYSEGDVTIPAGFSFNTGEFDYNGTEMTNKTGNTYYIINDTDKPVTIHTVGGGMANSTDIQRLKTIELDGGCGGGGCDVVTVYSASDMKNPIWFYKE